MQVVVAVMAGLLSVLDAFETEVEEDEEEPPVAIVPVKESKKRPKSTVFYGLKKPPHRQSSQLEMFA